jgi:hypothetical protein
MTYRPEHKQGEGKSESLDSYYARKQQMKHNQLRGEAEVHHEADRDADAEENFSYGKGGYSKPKEKPGKNYNPSSHDIWSDEPWKDKS